MKRLCMCLLAMAVMAQIYGQEPLRRVTVMPRIGMTASTMWGKQATGSRLRIGGVVGADVEYRFFTKMGSSTRRRGPFDRLEHSFRQPELGERTAGGVYWCASYGRLPCYTQVDN